MYHGSIEVTTSFVCFLCQHPTTRDVGLFVALKRLSKDSGPAPAVLVSGSRGRKPSKDVKTKSESYVTARAIEAHGNVQMSHDLQVTKEN